MANKKISELTELTAVDAGSDMLPIVDVSAGTTKKIKPSNVLGLVGSALGTTDTQTVSNKTVDNTNTVTVKDANFTVQDDADTTKQAKLQLSGITTGTTRTYTLPDATTTLVGTDTTQTLTNKTLTSPTISDPTVSNGSFTTPKIVTSINDSNGNEVIKTPATASAVNEFTATNAATGNAPNLSSTGDDTNIDLKLTPKGTGRVKKAGNNIDTWEELGRTTLSGTADTITVSGLTAKKYLKIMANIVPSGAIQANLRFNNDSGNNYARRDSADGAADTTSTSQSSISLGNSASNIFAVYYVLNVATREKTVDYRLVFLTAAGAGTAPSRQEGAGKWANTSDAITRVDLVNGGAGDYAAGSEVMVLGHD